MFRWVRFPLPQPLGGARNEILLHEMERRKAYLGSLNPLYIGWPQGGDESPKLVLLGASPSHPASL